MKILFGASILLILVGATMATNTGISGTWMFQAGVILLFGVVAIFVTEKFLATEYFYIWKTVGVASFGLMLLLTIWGFLNGIWSAHPLGFIIALAGCIWVFYRGMKSRKSLVSIKSDVCNQNESK